MGLFSWKNRTAGSPQDVSASSDRPGKRAPLTFSGMLLDQLKTLLLAVLIALFLRIVVFQPFSIPSGSMIPGLQVGDFLVVSKFSYGYSRASLVYPFTRLPVKGRFAGGDPRRGDVAVFKNRKDLNRDYIKRIVGMPGDEIMLVNSVLHINGVAVERKFEGIAEGACGPFPGPVYTETLPGGTSYRIQECAGNNGPLDNVGPYRVPPGSYFMMGDNRDRSQDSRVTSAVGYVDGSDLVGRAEFVFFSVDGTKGKLWQPWTWPFAVRYTRIFQRIK